MKDDDFLTYQESKAIIESSFNPDVYALMLKAAAKRREAAERAFLRSLRPFYSTGKRTR
jgi:hypothetical protein